MSKPIEPLEILWDNLLSRQPERIQSAFRQLDAAGQQGVWRHLQRMATEPGWHPEQVRSAQVALDSLKSFTA
jgi:hypothetical protein